MAYYYCHNCGDYITENDLKEDREYHFEIDGGFYETYSVCPNCSSSSIEEVDNCVACGEPDIDLLEGFCPTCREALFGELDKWVTDHTSGDITRDNILDLIGEWLDRQ